MGLLVCCKQVRNEQGQIDFWKCWRIKIAEEERTITPESRPSFGQKQKNTFPKILLHMTFQFQPQVFFSLPKDQVTETKNRMMLL
jgi:hypothetical protein